MLSPQGRFSVPAVIANRCAHWCGNPFSKTGLPVFINCGSSETLHLGYPPRVKIRGTKEYAGVVELADTYDLGSYVVRHAGSSPVARTKKTAVFRVKKFGKQPFLFGSMSIVGVEIKKKSLQVVSG